MSAYTIKDLPETRHVSVPVYVKDIARFPVSNEIFQLYCAMGDRDYDAGIKLARYIIARDPRLKGTQLDVNANRSARGLGYNAAGYGIDAAVTLLEWAVNAYGAHGRMQLLGEAHYLLGHCYEFELGWRFNTVTPGLGAFQEWSEDHRSMQWAEKEYTAAANNGYDAAYLELSRLCEFKSVNRGRIGGDSTDAQRNAEFAAYWALTAIAKGVKGARERYAQLKAKGMDGGNMLAIFRSTHPDVKI